MGRAGEGSYTLLSTYPQGGLEAKGEKTYPDGCNDIWDFLLQPYPDCLDWAWSLGLYSTV